MIDISFEINGRKVNPAKLSDTFERLAFEGIRNSILERVGQARCPEHNQAPRIACTGRTIQHLEFRVSGCCEKLVEAIKAKLG